MCQKSLQPRRNNDGLSRPHFSILDSIVLEKPFTILWCVHLRSKSQGLLLKLGNDDGSLFTLQLISPWDPKTNLFIFVSRSETRPPEDDEEEEEEILGSDDDEQEDPKDYVKGSSSLGPYFSFGTL